ncbi:MAG TPA: triple tyrosine motif-containing protein [Steroidobacteraceae bacterium]|nr:triple tyrosine motif-containing protein [Steroidobacteraceae bacterium]
MRRPSRRIRPALLVISCCASGWSLGAGPILEQLNHRAYSAAEGAPSLVQSIAQSTDGTLWLGSSVGLFRFDGIRFVRYPAAGDEPLPSINIKALTAAPDGGLWVAFMQSGLSYLRDGRVTSYGPWDGLPDFGVTQFGWDHEGGLWVEAVYQLARLRGHHWEKVASFDNPLRGFAVDRAGRLWVATTRQVLVRDPGQNNFRAIAEVEVPYSTHPFIAASPAGAVWSLLPGGVLRRMDPALTSHDGGERLSIPEKNVLGPVLFDTEGNLWFGGSLLHRVSADQLTATGRIDESTARVESFGQVEGLTAPTFVSALFQDREENVWVSTNGGINRFSKTNAVRLLLPLCSGIGYALVAGEAGTLWAACPRRDSPVGSLTEIRNGSIVGQQDTEKFTAGHRDAEGGIWFGGPNALGHLESGRVVTTPLPAELRGLDVQLITRDRDGTLWVGIATKGMFHVTNGRWSLYESLPTGEAPQADTTDPQGALWFGYTVSRVARMQDGKVRLFDAHDGLKIGHVTALLAQGGEIWAGGELGFARYDGKRFVPVLTGCGSSFTGISGIVGTKSGDLWLNAIGGIAHIPHEELEHLARDPDQRMKCEILDSLDGVPGIPIQTRPVPTALATSDGRLWFALSGGIISVDPDHLIRNALPPPVRIWSITSQGKEYANRGSLIELPIHTKDLRVNYTAGSLSIPERVRFRYELDGLDNDWHDGGYRRDAVYTNLGPGRYTFHVIASNNDGKWNEVGSSIAFRIAPAFYQTRWFYALYTLTGCALLFAAYRVRVRLLAREFDLKLEVRVDERTRIARELHDTLLQSFQGLLLRFETVLALCETRPAEAKEVLRSSIDQTAQAITEGREAVQALRASTVESNDLAQAITTLGDQLAAEESSATPVGLHVEVQGTPRNLRPIVRDEFYRVASEALRNAFRHAEAEQIEVEFCYDARHVRLRVRDDGKGIDPNFLAAEGRAGHFGLHGMRERAKLVGGKLTVWTAPYSGTEIELNIPASHAYADSGRSWFAEKFSGKSETKS